MTLWSRLTSLARADAHGVLDALEEPSLVLRQQLREAEAELQRKRSLIESAKVEAEALTKEDLRLEEQIGELDADIELALQHAADPATDGPGLDREPGCDNAGHRFGELARFSIRRLVSHRNRRREIATRLESLTEERASLEENLDRQADELRELKQRVRAELARLERNSSSDHDLGSTGSWERSAVTEEEVELELLRRRARIDVTSTGPTNVGIPVGES